MVSTLQSKLDEGKCPVPPVGGSSEGPEVQLEAVQRVLLQREDEVGAGSATRARPSLCVREQGGASSR